LGRTRRAREETEWTQGPGKGGEKITAARLEMTETKCVEEAMSERRLEKEIEIAAPASEVWKALTESKELANGFRWKRGAEKPSCV
jgi:hypothetical protein